MLSQKRYNECPPRTSGGTHCRGWNCNFGYYNHLEDEKKSLFKFPKDEERYVFSTIVIDQQSFMSL